MRQRPWSVETTIDRASSAEEYVRARGRWLVRCAYLLTSDRDAALDLAQETSLRVWRSWARVSTADDVDAYVLRTMMNALRSQRRRRRVSEVPLERAGDVAPETNPDLDPAVADAVGRLPQRQRSVLVLRFWADLDDAAIAIVLGCRVATVRSLRSRAVRNVRDDLRRSSPTSVTSPTADQQEGRA